MAGLNPREAAERQALDGLRVGVYGSGGAPWHHLALAALHGAQAVPVRAEDVATGRLEALDVLIVPGGGATAMHGMLAPLGAEGTERIRAWVADGGTWVSSCAGSVLPLALSGEADAALPAARGLRMTPATLANPGDATLGGLASPGVGRIRVRPEADHPYAKDLPSELELVHYNGPFFALPDGTEASTVRPFARPVGVTESFTPAEAFLPPPSGRPGLPETMDRAILERAATAIVTTAGKGRVVQFGSHPEFGLGPLLLGWGDGARLLLAALADAPRRSGPGAPAPDWNAAPERPDRSPADAAHAAADLLDRAADAFAALHARDPGGWTAPERSAAFGGRDARTIWDEDLPVASEVARDAATEARRLAPGLGPDALPWLDDAPRSGQDFGFEGLVQAAARIVGATDAAATALERPPQDPAHAYDLFDRHPYHLAVASYLSAAGWTAGAALGVAVLASRAGGPSEALERRLFLERGPD